MSREGRITHNTAGRVNVERGDSSITLRLWQHSLSPEAVLTFAEAEKLIDNMRKAMAPEPDKMRAPPEDHSDLA